MKLIIGCFELKFFLPHYFQSKGIKLFSGMLVFDQKILFIPA